MQVFGKFYIWKKPSLHIFYTFLIFTIVHWRPNLFQSLHKNQQINYGDGKYIKSFFLGILFVILNIKVGKTQEFFSFQV
jgi:hypothetical protein